MKVMKLSKQFAKNHTFSVELDSQSTNESVRSAGSSPTLIHKEIVKKKTNDSDKLLLVLQDLECLKDCSCYYFRAVTWVKAERKVCSGELPG